LQVYWQQKHKNFICPSCVSKENMKNQQERKCEIFNLKKDWIFETFRNYYGKIKNLRLTASKLMGIF